MASAEQTISLRFKMPLDAGSRDEGFWFDWQFGRILLREAKATVARSQTFSSINAN